MNREPALQGFADATSLELPNRCNREAHPSLCFGSAAWGITDVGDHARRQGLVCDECGVQAGRGSVDPRVDGPAVVAGVTADPR